MSEMRFW